MPRASAGFRSTGGGSATLPIGGLVPSANVDLQVVEVGVFNTTANAVSIGLRRITAAGTPGAATVTPLSWSPDQPAPTATPKDTWTVAPTFTTGALAVATLGAAIGSGMVWTFGGAGIRIPKGTGNGLVWVPWTGSGQILDWYVVWDE